MKKCRNFSMVGLMSRNDQAAFPASGLPGSLLIMITFHLLGLISAIILARIMGPAGFGVYTFCMTAALFLKIPASLGAPQFIVREVSAYMAKHEWGLFRGLIRRSFQGIIVVSMIFTGIILMILPVVRADIPGVLRPAAGAALLLIPLLALLESRAAVLRGINHILLSQLPAAIIRPLVFIALISVLFFYRPHSFSPGAAMILQVVATGTALMLLLILLHGLMPGKARQAPAQYQTAAWFQSAWPCVVMAILQTGLQHNAIFFLGVLQNAEAVGLYRVAQRGADLIIFGLIGVNLVVGPTLSRLHTTGEMKRLQRVITGSARMAALFAVPVVLVLILFGPRLIPMVFGPEFLPAYQPLIILCLGQFFNAAMGPVGLILIMTGNERDATRGSALGVLTAVVFSFILIPGWGINGAAAAFSGGLMLSNIYWMMKLYRKTRLISLPVSTRPSKF